MADEPTLPTLPALPTVSWDCETQTFTNTRKRNRDQAAAPPLFTNSSDPAIFSSDDDPHLDNYTQERRPKKRYVGSWFQQHPASSDPACGEEVLPQPKAKRTFQRQLDSGVWMGSDCSIDLEDEAALSIEPPAEPRLPQLRYTGTAAVTNPAEDIARRKIQAAIDTGNEDIDLSSLGIKSISNATIAQISEFSCIPLVTEGVPFEHKDPSIKLYLYSNPLVRAPGALFNLEHLTVLSLRNTQITELPPSIGNLRNLVALNLSLTGLRYLPAELLDLIKHPGKLKNLTIHPNPFYRPDSPPQPPSIEEEAWDSNREDVVVLHESESPGGAVTRLWLEKDGGTRDDKDYPPIHDPCQPRWEAFILARSPVQYSDTRGVISSKFELPSRVLDRPVSEQQANVTIQTEDLTSLPTPARSTRDQLIAETHQSRVPSLLELTLQSCSRTTQLRELTSYLPPQTPAHFGQLFDRAIEQGEANANLGDLPCSVCKRRVMVPTAQWIEWWDLSVMTTMQQASARVPARVFLSLNKEEWPVPFLRRGCSWKCVPKPMKVGQWLPGLVRCHNEKAGDIA